MNGNWMNMLEAPTSRMMEVSRCRLMADNRIVVVISSTAATTMTRPSPTESIVARLRMLNSGSSVSRWSTTRSTPATPESSSAITWYCSGSTSFTR